MDQKLEAQRYLFIAADLHHPSSIYRPASVFKLVAKVFASGASLVLFLHRSYDPFVFITVTALQPSHGVQIYCTLWPDVCGSENLTSETYHYQRFFCDGQTSPCLRGWTDRGSRFWMVGYCNKEH